MPCLPNDPSVYLEPEDIEALAADLCERLRASHTLRPLLNTCVGNRWYDFERGLAGLMARELFSDAPELPELDWLLLPEASPSALAEAFDHLFEACLRRFPLNAAAALIEQADFWERALASVAKTPVRDRGPATARLRQRIAAGALTRAL